MDSGNLTHSIFALERVLAVEPDKVLARAEISRVYLMLGELRTSRQELETGTSGDRSLFPVNGIRPPGKAI